MLKGVLFAELNDGEKKALRSSQNSDLGLLNFGQMLLPAQLVRASDWRFESWLDFVYAMRP